MHLYLHQSTSDLGDQIHPIIGLPRTSIADKGVHFKMLFSSPTSMRRTTTTTPKPAPSFVSPTFTNYVNRANNASAVCTSRGRANMAIAVGTRVRIKADIEIYCVRGQLYKAHNVKNCEGVVLKDVIQSFGENYTATKPYIVQCEEPRFKAHFGEDELEVIE